MLTEDKVQEYLESEDPTERGCALIAGALFAVAFELRALGKGSQQEPGAVEFLGIAVKEGLETLATAVEAKE